MSKNYSREARLSRKNAESVISRARLVSLLYSATVMILLALGYMFLLELGGTLGFDFWDKYFNKCETKGTGFMDTVSMQALMHLINSLTSGALVFDTKFIFALILILPFIYFFLVLGYYLLKLILLILYGFIALFIPLDKKRILGPSVKYKNPKWKETKIMLKNTIRAEEERQKGLKLAYKNEPNSRNTIRKELNECENRLRKLKAQRSQMKKYFKTNRYAKNEHTAYAYRESRKEMRKKATTFIWIFRISAVVFFAWIIFKTVGLVEYQALETFPKAGFPSLGEILKPTLIKTESGVVRDTQYLYFVYIALGFGVFAHFLVGSLYGSVTKIRMVENSRTSIPMRAVPDMAVNEYTMDFDLDPDWEKWNRETMLEGKTSIATFDRKWDDSDAVLVERNREYPTTMFFFRNFAQVIFCFFMVAIFIYLFPAFGELEYLVKTSKPFDIILMILKILMCLSMFSLVIHAISIKEFEYDCMDESLERRKFDYRLALVSFIIVTAVYLVMVMFVITVPNSSGVSVTLQQLFTTAKPLDDPTAKGVFTPIFWGIVICLALLAVSSSAALTCDILIKPKDPVKKQDDFFAFLGRQYPNTPDDGE